MPDTGAVRELREQREEGAAVADNPNQMRPLLHGDDEGESPGIAAQYRSGDERRDGPEPQRAGECEGNTGADHEERGEHDLLRRIGGTECHQRRGQDRSRGRGRRDDRVAAAPDQPVADQAGEQCDHAGLRRQTRKT